MYALVSLLFMTAGEHLVASSVYAQRARLEIILPAKDKLAAEAPKVRAMGMITSKQTSELIRNGFPARLHFKIERWTGGTLVNEVKATTDWEVIVEYDALNKVYRVVRATADRATVLGEYKELRDAETKVAEPFQPPIVPPRPGQKSYYTVTLDVEAMSLSDLDEVRRWVKGELRPAMGGKRNPGTAVTSGIRRFFVKLLGGERVRYQANTGVFTPP
jgi:hypothetical protein